MTTSTALKVRENRLRRMAERRRLRLVKNRRRDPGAYDYGGYALVDVELNGAVFGWGPDGTPTADLDEVEQFLAGGYPSQAQGGPS